MGSGFHLFAADANEGNRDVRVASRSRMGTGMEFNVVCYG